MRDDIQSAIDYRRLFENLPGLYVVVQPDMTIAAVSDDYLKTTMIKREHAIGQKLFEIFPENPDDQHSHGMANIRGSLEKVFKTGVADVLPIQKYDIQTPPEEGSEYTERYWKLSSFPGFNERGQVIYAVHQIEDITDKITLARKEADHEKINFALQKQTAQIESERNAAAAALKDAQMRLETALDAGEIGTWTWNVVNDTVVADKNLANFFSVSEADAAGGKIEKYLAAMHPDDLARVNQKIAEALESEDSYEAEYRLVNPQGEIRWVVARGRILRDENGKPFQLPGVVIDITDRKKAENNLRESERRLKFALDAGGFGSYEFNPETGEMQCSPRCLANFGLPPETDFPFVKILSMIHPDDRNRFEQAVRESIANHTVYEIEYRIMRVDGTPAWIFARGRGLYDERGKPLTMHGVTLDITSRKQRDEELRKSQERLQLVLSSSQLGLWYCDLPFDVLNWSALTKEHFWLPPEATVTIDDFYRIIHHEDREQTRAAIDKSIAEKTQYDVEYRTVSPTGERVKWIRAVGRGFYDESGKPYRFDGITIDVSEDKMIQSEREHLLSSEKNARAEAEQANRLKDDFLATLSHELRTPLSSILGWSRLLREGKIDSVGQQQRALETIERNAKAQSQLIEDILDVSRIISGKLRLDVRPVELASIIELAINSVLPAVDAKEIRLQRVIDTEAMISGDADRLQQIIWNLLSNAIKFTPKGGKVQVKLERVNSHVEIVIADTGIGIDAESLPFVFERFRQSDSSTTRQHGGLGLGLAIVRHLVELHGGTVHAASEGINQGTVFTLNFPIIVLRSKEVSFKEEESIERVHPTTDGDISFICPDEIKGLRILLVDDEPDMREMLSFIFESCESHVKSASSVAEALEIIKTETFDILVSDLGMPERDGYDLIRNIRRLAPEQNGRIPAIALTAYARTEDRMRVLSAGFQMHVSKPVEPVELLTVVASLVNRKII